MRNSELSAQLLTVSNNTFPGVPGQELCAFLRFVVTFAKLFCRFRIPLAVAQSTPLLWVILKILINLIGGKGVIMQFKFTFTWALKRLKILLTIANCFLRTSERQWQEGNSSRELPLPLWGTRKGPLSSAALCGAVNKQLSRDLEPPLSFLSFDNWIYFSG